MRALTIASTAIVTVVGVATAQAGGFAVREQSAYGQGSSFAGMAAPGEFDQLHVLEPCGGDFGDPPDGRGQRDRDFPAIGARCGPFTFLAHRVRHHR